MAITATVKGDSPSLNGRRILVVEDEYLVARHLGHMIREMGGNLLGPVPGVAEARAFATAEDVDAGVLDIKLGTSAVFALADAFVAQGIPIAFVSGYGRDRVPERFAGVPLLEKPVRAPSLARALARVIAVDESVPT